MIKVSQFAKTDMWHRQFQTNIKCEWESSNETFNDLIINVDEDGIIL